MTFLRRLFGQGTNPRSTSADCSGSGGADPAGEPEEVVADG